MPASDAAATPSAGGLRQPNSLGSQNSFQQPMPAGDNSGVMLAHSNASMPSTAISGSGSNNQGFGNSTMGAAA